MDCKDCIGSLAPGRNGDIASLNGAPFEYTSYLTAVRIEGPVVSDFVM